MSDDPVSEPERDEIAPHDEALQSEGSRDIRDRQMWAIEQLFKLERQRVDSNNRRTDVALRTIEASSASDERQFKYHVEKLRQGSQDRNERYRSALRFAWAFFTIAVAGGGLIFFMLFYGDDAQRIAARDLLRAIGTAVGGAGALWALKEAFQRVFASGSRDDD